MATNDFAAERTPLAVAAVATEDSKPATIAGVDTERLLVGIENDDSQVPDDERKRQPYACPAASKTTSVSFFDMSDADKVAAAAPRWNDLSVDDHPRRQYDVTHTTLQRFLLRRSER